ncbi:50S ribosomal protein L3 [filamentous cyanobacterium LEGE 11480]|uniref:Large ribosomal subunit protein uL3 n=1 Tax=Romeriopsis navalis LEGE 11480 TaxID=2777977 RepID=A0A928VU55_9CYAN|nr:50S ribosomal protein L3 [Romeriopsis navalis]MBE9032587.1 50S ribosomal protein L3 [Romeriopsis navalis LEGE 11480]
MAIGILGTKLGMTQVFTEDGKSIPVTVVQAGPCPVTQIKTQDTDGYSAVQIAYGDIKEKNLSKPEKGHLAKSGAAPLRHLVEWRIDDTAGYELGQEIKVDIFEEGQLVDVCGRSIGRGFMGNQKRHNFSRGPMTHGSKNHREPGSIGAGTTPGRIYPGKKMAGHMGDIRVTVKKLEVIRVDAEKNLILVKGAVPGKPGALLRVMPEKKVGNK